MAKPRQWECRTAREARAMVWWVNDQLSALDAAEHLRNVRGERSADERLASCIAQADRGNIEPLRKLFPQIPVRFIRLPARKRPSRHRRWDPVGGAVKDVARIRALWKKNFGRVNRARGDLVSAEQIAADRWEVHIDTLINRQKSPL
jgi:hypothetical protein